MYYELWDLRTSNLVEEFDTEAEALMFVRDVLQSDGEVAASGYVLGVQDPEAERGEAIAEGVELVQRAVRAYSLARPA
jgi:hypothetical protein